MKVAMKVSGVKGNTVLLPVGTIPAQHLEVGGSPVVLDVSGNFVGQVERWTLITNSPISSTPDKIPPQEYHRSPPSPSHPSDTPR